MTTRIPDILGTVYAAAVGRSKGHCECDLTAPGNCGLRDGDKPRDHKTGHRYHERGEHRAPRLVAPLDPELSGRDAIGLALDEVLVLCRTCYTRRRKKAD
ncbi:hypothetical protein [Streptomyces sp. NPDC001930]|uniref:hypothetical protein n=1 Tax=Streptomyces sp. NPDC001930 TaxID=3364625 RepID=UPI00367859F3